MNTDKSECIFCNDTKSDAEKFAVMADSLRGIAERNRALLPEGSAKLDVVATYLGGLSVSLGGSVVAAPRRLRILPLSEFVPTGINPEQARASWVELCAAIESARQDRDCPEVPK